VIIDGERVRRNRSWTGSSVRN